MTRLPEDLQRLAEAMNGADGAAEALAARVTDQEFFWQPDEGRRWSIALCLDHLTVANWVYGGAIQEAVARAGAAGSLRSGPATPGYFGRKFVALLEPPVRRRTSAPARIRPRPVTNRSDILRAYHEAHDAIRRSIVDAAAIDVNRTTFSNPFLRWIRVRVSTGFHVIAAHDRRHLWQAAQVENELRSTPRAQ